MKTALLVTLASAMFVAFTALRAEEPAPWFTTSEKGDFFFSMTPVQPKEGKAASKVMATGMAYAVEERTGDLRPLWRMEGAYAPDGFLSGDGKSLVCLGPVATDKEQHSDVAVTFYHEGRLLKQHLVKDLLQEASKVRSPAIHDEWRPQVQAEADGFTDNGQFRLSAIGQSVFLFEGATGEILSIQRVNEQAAVKPPGALLAGPPWPPEWNAAFEVSLHALETKEINTVKIHGWRAVLRPKKALAVPCEVLLWFPLGESGQIDTKLTPQEIVGALEKTLAHPFVTKRIQAGQTTGLRLFMQGNELNNDRDHLLQCLDYVQPDAALPRETVDLHHWARFSLLGPLNLKNWPDILVNTYTQDLIVMVPYIDFQTFWFDSYMLAADGTPSKIRTDQQVHNDEATRRGLELLQAASFKADYEARFVLSDVRVEEERETPHVKWHATLTPRQPLALECAASVELTVSKEGKLETQVTAAEIEEALRMAVKHPVVLRALQEEKEQKASRNRAISEMKEDWVEDRDPKLPPAPIMLKVGNQGLFPDRDELLGWLVGVKPGTDPEPQTAEWVCVKIWLRNSGSAGEPICLNQRTGEAMTRESGFDAYVMALWDAQGVRIKND